MKKGLLLLVGMSMMVSLVEAKEGINPTERTGVEYRYNEAVSFIERGVQFHVSLNGDFDFDSRYVRTRRNSRIRIRRDFRGRIRRVGNVTISYNSRGNVRRIGSVYMSYYRNSLTNVGQLGIHYNRWGDPVFYGQVRYNDYYYDNVNYYNPGISIGFNINLGAICVYNDPYFYRNEFRANYRQIREDDNFYYYRANKNSKVSRDRILKRRKPGKRATQSTGIRKRGETNSRVQKKKRSYTTPTQVKKRTQVKRRVTNNKKTQVTKKRRVQTSKKVKKRVYKKKATIKKRVPAKKKIEKSRKRRS
ncbi:MAG: hypothetical protein JKY02_02765 [Flavobacteriaceae bacterium]|nr:hypothetical protein [Flavobacteriaceae bacterium]